MRVAFVIGGLPFGGVERFLLDLTTGLQKERKFDVSVFNLSGTGILSEEYAECRVAVVNVGMGHGAINTHRVDTALRLRSLIRNYAPDIIHTQHFSGDYFGRISSIGFCVPVVTHIHNVRVEKKCFRRSINRILSHATDLYISVSGAVRDMVQREHNRAGRKSIVLYNAVDFSKFPEVGHDLGSLLGAPGRYCVAVGRLVPVKKYDLLLDAWAILARRVADARLLIIGDGPERERLQSRLESLGLQGSAFLGGYRKDVGSYLRGAYVFAMPSLSEGLGIAHIEAMHAGLPAVLSPAVPSLEFSADCSLVATWDAEDLARKLERLYVEPQLYERMSEDARRIAARLNMPGYIDRLCCIYEALIKKDEEFFRNLNPIYND